MFHGQLGESRTGIKFLITISLLILNYFVKKTKYSTSSNPLFLKKLGIFYGLCWKEVCRIAWCLFNFGKGHLANITKMDADIILKTPPAINQLSLCLSTLLLASAVESLWKLHWLQGHHSWLSPLSHRIFAVTAYREGSTSELCRASLLTHENALQQQVLNSEYCFRALQISSAQDQGIFFSSAISDVGPLEVKAMAFSYTLLPSL